MSTTKNTTMDSWKRHKREERRRFYDADALAGAVMSVVALRGRITQNGDPPAPWINYVVTVNGDPVKSLRPGGVTPARNIIDLPGLKHVRSGADWLRDRLHAVMLLLARLAPESRIAEKRSAGLRVLGQWSSTPVAARPFAPRGTPVPA